MEDIRTTLNERAKTHGDYARTAMASQAMKDIIHQGDSWCVMTPAEREAADMIVHKLARATNGDPHEIDHWRDIIGYAQLAVDGIGRTPIQER